MKGLGLGIGVGSATRGGASVVPTPSADRWWIDVNGAVDPQSLAGAPLSGYALSDLKFMIAEDAGANAGTGSAIDVSGTWTDEANLFAGGTATMGFSTSADARVGFQFDAEHQITHLSISARDDAFWPQAPKSLDVYYSTDGGTTPVLYKHVPIEETWTQGATKVIALADQPDTSDMSSLDEVGGYRYYAIKVTGNSFAAGATCFLSEFVLKNDTVAIGTKAHRNRHSGIVLSADWPLDGRAANGTDYFSITVNGYLIIDLGYKRVIDEFGYTARVDFPTQAPTKLELYGLDTSMADDDSWTLAEMSLLKSVDDSASAAPASGATRTFTYP